MRRFKPPERTLGVGALFVEELFGVWFCFIRQYWRFWQANDHWRCNVYLFGFRFCPISFHEIATSWNFLKSQFVGKTCLPKIVPWVDNWTLKMKLKYYVIEEVIDDFYFLFGIRWCMFFRWWSSAYDLYYRVVGYRDVDQWIRRNLSKTLTCCESDWHLSKNDYDLYWLP